MHMFSQCHAYVAENVLLDSRLALFHEEEKWLAVTDLHFGFELSQRMAGPAAWATVRGASAAPARRSPAPGGR